VAQWLALLPHSTRDPGCIPASGPSLCRVCTFSPCLHGCPSFPPQSKDVWVSLIGYGKSILVSGFMWVYGKGSVWDCDRCKADGPNDLLPHCIDSMVCGYRLGLGRRLRTSALSGGRCSLCNTLTTSPSNHVTSS